MQEFVIGFFTALTIGGALALGVMLGKKHRSPAAPEQREEEQQRLLEDQKAFEDLLHYNASVAYGMSELGGERE